MIEPICKDVDALCGELTAMQSMDELVSTDRSYRPTMLISDDSRYAILAREFNLRVVAKGQSRRAIVEFGRKSHYDSRIDAAKAWAKKYGCEEGQGGWIFSPNGHPVEPGWRSFSLMLEQANRIVEVDSRWVIVK